MPEVPAPTEAPPLRNPGSEEDTHEITRSRAPAFLRGNVSSDETPLRNRGSEDGRRPWSSRPKPETYGGTPAHGPS